MRKASRRCLCCWNCDWLMADPAQPVRRSLRGIRPSHQGAGWNPKPASNPEKHVTQTFLGRAMIILKKTAEAENVVLTLTDENGAAESLKLSLADLESDQQALRVSESVKL